MKLSIWKQFGFAALLLGFSHVGSAVTFTDVVDFGGTGNLYMSGGDPLDLTDNDSVTYTHDISDDGYSPFTHNLLSAVMEVAVTDDDLLFLEYVYIDLAGLFNDMLEEVGFNQTITVNLGGLGLLDLWFDGMFDVTITATLGDFFLVSSTLTAEAAEIPEPSTLVLLAVGLLGMGLTGRKLLR